MLRVRLVALGALSLFSLCLSPAATWADRVHLATGEVLDVSVKDVEGPLIRYRRRGIFPQYGKVQRLELAAPIDRVERRDGTIVVGEIFSMNNRQVELNTAQGRLSIPRWVVRDIWMGKGQ